MSVRVLGTVDVVDDAHTMLAIGGPIQARLLAVLVAKRPEAVSIDDLIAQVWLDDADLPDDPVGAVRTYVARLRRSLGPDTIVTGNSAYSLGEIDVDATRLRCADRLGEPFDEGEQQRLVLRRERVRAITLPARSKQRLEQEEHQDRPDHDRRVAP